MAGCYMRCNAEYFLVVLVTAQKFFAINITHVCLNPKNYFLWSIAIRQMLRNGNVKVVRLKIYTCHSSKKKKKSQETFLMALYWICHLAGRPITGLWKKMYQKDHRPEGRWKILLNTPFLIFINQDLINNRKNIRSRKSFKDTTGIQVL